MNTREIIQSSLRAPGLPNFPRQTPTQADSRSVPILSINFDFLPGGMSLFFPTKILWIDLDRPAPADMNVGTPARLFLSVKKGIPTMPGDRKSVFQIEDIIGSRVILSPYKGSAWLPTVHQACDNPFGWGYDLTNINVSTSHHGTKYGYGSPTGHLEYYPQYYSNTPLNR